MASSCFRNKKLRINTNKLIKFVNNSSDNFIVINSNNDPGTKLS